MTIFGRILSLFMPFAMARSEYDAIREFRRLAPRRMPWTPSPPIYELSNMPISERLRIFSHAAPPRRSGAHARHFIIGYPLRREKRFPRAVCFGRFQANAVMIIYARASAPSSLEPRLR